MSDQPTSRRTDRAAVLAEIVPLAARHFKVDESALSASTKLREDLRADSLDLVLLVHDLEDHFGITVSQESLVSVKTLGDAAAMIVSSPSR